ncbi:hypothetical protein F4810DRAFT_644320 [Camillea tinctor]|nr:hypothetical protein F4810DRAFT_644320 [Camillea tinctor]
MATPAFVPVLRPEFVPCVVVVVGLELGVVSAVLVPWSLVWLGSLDSRGSSVRVVDVDVDVDADVVDPVDEASVKDK